MRERMTVGVLADHKLAEAARRMDAVAPPCRERAAGAAGFGRRYLLNARSHRRHRAAADM
jgi:hypothetical protein